jgi:hypothetical protein
MAAIRVIATPVVFTNNAGGGRDEIQAPPTGAASVEFDTGRTVQAAWWVPCDNTRDVSAIHTISVSPNGSRARLTVGGRPGQPDARVRIMIYVATA